MRREEDESSSTATAGTRDARQGSPTTVAVVVFLVALAYYHTSLTRWEAPGVLQCVGTAAAACALVGALGGALGFHLGLWRPSRVRAWGHFTWGTCLASAAVGFFALVMPPANVKVAATLAAVGFGAVAGTVVQFLLHGSSPTYYYGLALLRARRGNRDGACEAIGTYLLISHNDPDGATRRPIAERFLRDTNASLELPTELLSADTPAGRGTEPEHTLAPPGRGTEPEQAPPPSGKVGN